MSQYSSNLQNIQRKKCIQTPPLETKYSASQTLLTIQSKHSITEKEDYNPNY